MNFDSSTGYRCRFQNFSTNLYKESELIANRPFISTSQSPKGAEPFGSVGDNNRLRRDPFHTTFLEVVVHLTYKKQRAQTYAIDIGNFSKFLSEEVLFIPTSTFRIIEIKHNTQMKQNIVSLLMSVIYHRNMIERLHQ